MIQKEITMTLIGKRVRVEFNCGISYIVGTLDSCDRGHLQISSGPGGYVVPLVAVKSIKEEGGAA